MAPRVGKDPEIAELLEELKSVSVAVTALTIEHSKTNAELTKVDDKTDKNRLWIIITAISVVLDVLLSGGVWYYANKANDASNQAKAASVIATQASNKATEATSAAAESVRTQKVTCEAANVSRKLNRDLWQYIFTVSAQDQPEQTDVQKNKATEFLNHINEVYADRNCDDLNDVPAVTSPNITPGLELPSPSPTP